MLIPANNNPGEPKKISDAVDPSEYILSITANGIKSALDGIQFTSRIEIEENTNNLRAEINREIIRLQNQGMTIGEIVVRIIGLIKILSALNEEIDISEEDVDKNEAVIENAFTFISKDLGIPPHFSYEQKITSIADLIEKYNKLKKNKEV